MEGEILPIEDKDHNAILLLVELAVVLVNSVLRVPAISQHGQEVDQDIRESSRTNRHSVAHDLRCGMHLKQKEFKDVK